MRVSRVPLLLFLFSCILSNYLQAQCYTPWKEQSPQLEGRILKDSKLLVVIDEFEKSFLPKVKEAFAKYWKFTEVEFITSEQIPGYSGLVYGYFIPVEVKGLCPQTSEYAPPRTKEYGYGIYLNKSPNLKSLKDGICAGFVPVCGITTTSIHSGLDSLAHLESKEKIFEAAEEFFPLYLIRLQRIVTDFYEGVRPLESYHALSIISFDQGEKKLKNQIVVLDKLYRDHPKTIKKFCKRLKISPSKLHIVDTKTLIEYYKDQPDDMVFIFDKWLNYLTIYDSQGSLLVMFRRI